MTQILTEGLQEQKLIELKHIARALNELVGPDFVVAVNGFTESEKQGRTEILLQATRIPFAVTGIGSETLDVTLEVWANAQNSEMRDETLAKLNNLIGHKSGEIETPDAVYTFASFFEFDKPKDVQQVDIGAARKHLLDIKGTMLVSNATTGAIIANTVLTQLYVGEPDAAATVRGFVPTLLIETSLNYASETVPTGNNNTANTLNSTQACNISLSALALKRPLEDALLRIIQLAQAGFGLNDAVYVRRIYPTFEITKKCRLIGGKITEQAGTYLQYSLSLQEVI